MVPRPLSEGVGTNNGVMLVLVPVSASVSDDDDDGEGGGQTRREDSIRALRTNAEPVSRWQVEQ